MAVGVWLSDSIDSVPRSPELDSSLLRRPECLLKGEVVRDGARMLGSLKEI